MNADLQTVRLLTEKGWKMTLIADHVTMFENGPITLTMSPMNGEMPCHVSNDGVVIGMFRDLPRAALFATAEHTCQMQADMATKEFSTEH